MQHIANSAPGMHARNQQELLELAMGSSSFTEESIEHPLCEIGFGDYGENGIERMTPLNFKMSILSLLKSRPTWRYIDIIPEVPYKREDVFNKAVQGYRMSFDQKAQFLSDQFAVRPNMVGFRLELHEVDSQTSNNRIKPSLSCIIYEAEEDVIDQIVPVVINCMYRTNF
jgi:hypothetical protein